MYRRRQFARVLFSIILSGAAVSMGSAASAQTIGDQNGRGRVLPVSMLTDQHAVSSNTRLSRLKLPDVQILVVPTERARWLRESSLKPFQAVPGKTRRSKLRSTLIGAAIGAAVGGAGGFYVGEATGGDAHPWAVPAFAGIGAGIGAITGLVVASF
jgi:hypothetical protein